MAATIYVVEQKLAGKWEPVAGGLWFVPRMAYARLHEILAMSPTARLRIITKSSRRTRVLFEPEEVPRGE